MAPELLHTLLKLLLSSALAWLGGVALWTGTIETSGPEGAGPRCRVQGVAARAIGALMLSAAALLFVSVGMGRLVLAMAAVGASFACSRSTG